MKNLEISTRHIILILVILFSSIGYPISASGLHSSTGLRLLAPAAPGQVVITADIGGNVADSNLDGSGDNHNNLPGSVPGLISAAVDSSGGDGSNGTVRMQFEWNLAAIDSALAIHSAAVNLNTVQGSVDILDTFFYHGTSDQDGLLSDTDFEAPASQIPGVIMPVSTAGEFSFDVTDYLKADLGGGNNYFSVQGRVDEALIGTGFKRGLQVSSTATSNDLLLMPRLVVTYCYPLTLVHTGSGDDPLAVPGNSTGCPAGEYIADASIDLTANPAVGWHVASWSGTEDDASTSISNTASMPDSAHTVIVNYEQYNGLIFVPLVLK